MSSITVPFAAEEQADRDDKAHYEQDCLLAKNCGSFSEKTDLFNDRVNGHRFETFPVHEGRFKTPIFRIVRNGRDGFFRDSGERVQRLMKEVKRAVTRDQ